MSKNIQNYSSEIFIDLPEKAQESVYGGSLYSSLNLSNIFFQKTEIASFANTSTNYSDGINSISSNQQTGYKLSQFTFGFSGAEFGRGSGLRSIRSRQNLLNMLFGLMSLLG